MKMLKMDLISPVQRTGQFMDVKVSTIFCFFYVLNLIDIALLQNSWQQKHVYLCASYLAKCAANSFLKAIRGGGAGWGSISVY